MIKLEIEYFDKKEINTYDIDDVKFLCDERKVEIPGMMPYYEGQIELVSTDKNLIDFLNPSNNLEEIARDILHHKCIMTSYYSIKDISSVGDGGICCRFGQCTGYWRKTGRWLCNKLHRHK